MADGYNVAVVGATGAVGTQMLTLLQARKFPIKEITALASARSAGTRVRHGPGALEVKELTLDSFAGIDLALFSAGGGVSKAYAPVAAKAGCIVIDNTSAFRMEPDVPLVVPEVNGEAALDAPRRIIANPNCSTIQMVVALDPIRRAAGLERIVVSTYQAVSGAGIRAIRELRQQLASLAAGNPIPQASVFPHPIAGECLPQIGAFTESGDTEEEVKMVRETRKIFGLPELRVSATTVRVPVETGHSESINVEMKRPLSVGEARQLLSRAPAVKLVDDPSEQAYPLARQAAHSDPVYVGRLRQDPSVPFGLNLWVVADNLRKGAALNAIQIAELLRDRGALPQRG